MAGFNDIDNVLHKIKVKLYPNYFIKASGAYIARTNNDSSLTIDGICSSLKSRGGFAGDYDSLSSNVKLFFDEMAYLLCDGFAIDTGYFSIHPNIGGTFNAANETHNHMKNPISFRFRTKAKLRKLISRIAVEIEGLADTAGFIGGFIDYDTNVPNPDLIPGNQFCITGHKIKIAGDDPSCGLYFVSVDDPSKEVKVTRLAENSPAKLTGIIPETASAQSSILIRTQYAGSGGTLLKHPRVIAKKYIPEQA